MRRYGLIGWPLGHSFSKAYFSEKFRREGVQDAAYELFPIQSATELTGILAQYPDLCGLNVTIPHKETVMPLLQELDETARAVGAVNCIKVGAGGHLKGYNTDVLGFEQSLRNMPGFSVNIGQALILGTGGAAKAVAYVLRKLQIPYRFVSRSPRTAQEISYTELQHTSCALLINTTPLGTFPETDQMPPVPTQMFQPGMFVFDLIYNPAETLLLREAKQRGCHIRNGLEMLELQAEAAWHIWQT
ncbi:MAG TPA: shikimate dehydrogenase [Saprospiraceae bacterium]|nr:shikimate dehydrogenase [Saprospiraceae bacterium]